MTTSYTKESKGTTPYAKSGRISYLLKEDSFYLLLETGEKIVLDRGFQLATYTKEGNPTTSYSKESK